MLVKVLDFTLYQHAKPNPNPNPNLMLVKGEVENLSSLIHSARETEIEDAIAESTCLRYSLSAKIKLLEEDVPAAYIWFDMPTLQGIETKDSAELSLKLVQELTDSLEMWLQHRFDDAQNRIIGTQIEIEILSP